MSSPFAGGAHPLMWRLHDFRCLVPCLLSCARPQSLKLLLLCCCCCCQGCIRRAGSPPPHPPFRAPSPATVSLTASASFNGMCIRRQPPPTASATSSNQRPVQLPLPLGSLPFYFNPGCCCCPLLLYCDNIQMVRRRRKARNGDVQRPGPSSQSALPGVSREPT